MSTISLKRQGEIGFLVLQGCETPLEKWISSFKSIEEVKFAQKDTQGALARLPLAARTVTKDRLEQAAERFIGVLPIVSDTSGSQNLDNSRRIVPNPPTTTIVEQVSSNMAIVETDKGSFYHMGNWKAKLGAAFKHLDGFDQIFVMACMEAKVDPTISYISETKKKAVNAQLIECSNRYIAQLAETL